MAKQLTLGERTIIEQGLHRNETFTQIAQQLGRSVSTITREVRRYRVFVEDFPAQGRNDCTKRFTSLRNNLCEPGEREGCYGLRCKS